MSTSAPSLVEKLRSGARSLPLLPRAFALMWSASGAWTAGWIALLVVGGLLPGVTVTLVRDVVDGLVTALGGIEVGWERLRPVLPVLVLLGSLILLGELLGIFSQWLQTVQAERVRDHISELIHRRSTRVDLSYFENSEFFDQLHRARTHARSQPVALLENAGGLLRSILTLLAMMVILLPYGPWLPLLLALSVVPTLLVVVSFTLQEYRWRHGVAERERRALYYDWVMSSPEGAAELRLFALGDHFRHLFRALRQELRHERLRFAARECRAQIGALALSLLVLGGGLVWMLGRLAEGQISLGDLALFYQALHQSQKVLRGALAHAGEMYSSLLTLGDLFTFLDLRPGIVTPSTPVPVPAKIHQQIRFRGVGFTYPGSQRPVLKDFDLTLPAGRTVAIIGANGSGKSTLIKLLCRLYDPQQGRIEIDGTDLRCFDPGALRRRFTVLFQDPLAFCVSVHDNIRYGDLNADADSAAIAEAARAAGADGPIARLPRGYESRLGKWFLEGEELSGGEWQRLALARAFFRRAPVILLDEPTSAMDAWAEADWLGRFKELARGRTAVFITHRFTTAVQADLIHVMDGGRILESGTHQELLALGGRYAEAWRHQIRSE